MGSMLEVKDGAAILKIVWSVHGFPMLTKKADTGMGICFLL